MPLIFLCLTWSINTSANTCSQYLRYFSPNNDSEFSNKTTLNFLQRLAFQSSLTSMAPLWKVPDSQRIHIPGVRFQCTGNCNYESGHTAIEQSMRTSAYLKEGEALSGFFNQMKIAWLRFNHPYETHRRININSILTRVSDKNVFQSVFLGPNIVFSSGNRRAKYRDFVDLDNDLLSFVNRRSLSLIGRQRLKELLNLDFESFLSEVEAIVNERLNSKRKYQRLKITANIQAPVKIRAKKIFLMKDYYVLERRKSNDDRVWGWPMTNEPQEYIYGFRNITDILVEAIDQGKIPHLSLSKIFSRRVGHAIALTGYLKGSQGEIKGFEYANSWGEGYSINGKGFINTNYLFIGFNSVNIIESINYQ